jgi:hypothetical protein
MRDLNTQATTVDLMRMAFWALHTDDDAMTTADLFRMSDALQALAEDAVSYWMEHGRAPEICPPQEDA